VAFKDSVLVHYLHDTSPPFLDSPARFLTVDTRYGCLWTVNNSGIIDEELKQEFEAENPGR